MPSGNLCYIPYEHRMKGGVCIVHQPAGRAPIPELPSTIPKLKEHKRRTEKPKRRPPGCGRNNALLARLLREDNYCWICGFAVLIAPTDPNHELRPSVDHVENDPDFLFEVSHKLAHAWCNSRRGKADKPLTQDMINSCRQHVLAKYGEQLGSTACNLDSSAPSHGEP